MTLIRTAKIVVALTLFSFSVSVGYAEKAEEGSIKNKRDLIVRQSDVLLNNYYDTLNASRAELDTLLMQNRRWLEDIEIESQELDYLFVINQTNIFRQSFVFREINNLFRQVENKIIFYDDHIRVFRRQLRVVKELESQLSSSDILDPKDKEDRKRIEDGLHKLQGILQTNESDFQTQKQEFLCVYTRIKERVDSQKTTLNQDFRALLLRKQNGVFHPYFWKFFTSYFQLWLVNMPKTVLLQIPHKLLYLVIPCLAVLLVTVLCYCFVLRYCRNKYGTLFADHGHARTLLRRALLAGSCYITVIMLHWLTLPMEYQLIEVARLVFVMLFFNIFSWGIRVFLTKKELPLPFLPLYGLFILALLMRLTAAEYGVVVTLFPLGGIITILRLIKKQRLAYPKFEKNAILASIVFLTAMVLLTLVGFAYLSLFLSFCWVIVISIIQFGFSVTVFYEKSIRTQVEYHNLFGMLLITLVIPFVWVILSFQFIFITTNFLYMDVILYQYTSHEIKFYGMSVSFMDLLIMLFLFILIRGVMLTLKCFYRYVKDDTTEFQHTIVTLTQYLLWGIYCLIILQLLEVNYTSILVVLGGVSVGVGLGLQDIVKNFISGLLILFGKDLEPGDTVEINDIWGYVLKVNFRSTVLKTYENAIVTIPNSTILEKDFKNWTVNSPIARRDIKVGVAYGSDVATVKRLLTEVAENNEHVLEKPAATVLFNDFGNSALLFILRFWTDDIERNFVTQSELREEIDRVFRENGVTIAFPQMDVHLKEKTV